MEGSLDPQFILPVFFPFFCVRNSTGNIFNRRIKPNVEYLLLFPGNRNTPGEVAGNVPVSQPLPYPVEEVIGYFFLQIWVCGEPFLQFCRKGAKAEEVML